MKLPFVSRQEMDRKLARMRSEIDITRSRIDVSAELIQQFDEEKNSPEFLAAYEKDEPLVSICIATFNRADCLADRTIASLTAQTYRNIEIVIEIGGVFHDEMGHESRSLIQGEDGVDLPGAGTAEVGGDDLYLAGIFIPAQGGKHHDGIVHIALAGAQLSIFGQHFDEGGDVALLPEFQHMQINLAIKLAGNGKGAIVGGVIVIGPDFVAERTGSQ